QFDIILIGFVTAAIVAVGESFPIVIASIDLLHVVDKRLSSDLFGFDKFQEIQKMVFFRFMLFFFEVGGVPVVSSFDIIFKIFSKYLKQAPRCGINGCLIVNAFGCLKSLIFTSTAKLKFLGPFFVNNVWKLLAERLWVLPKLLQPKPKFMALKQDFWTAIRKMSSAC